MPDDLRERIELIQSKTGFVPNVFLALAHRPDEMRAFMAYHDALMEGPSGLSKAEREMIVVATSGANNCLYCVVAHGAILRIRTKDPLLADQLAVDPSKADLTDRQRAMIDFALKMCSEPWSVSSSDHDELRAHGFSDDDIWGHRRHHGAVRPVEPDGPPDVDAAKRRVLHDGSLTGPKLRRCLRDGLPGHGPAAVSPRRKRTQPLAQRAPRKARRTSASASSRSAAPS